MNTTVAHPAHRCYRRRRHAAPSTLPPRCVGDGGSGSSGERGVVAASVAASMDASAVDAVGGAGGRRDTETRLPRPSPPSALPPLPPLPPLRVGPHARADGYAAAAPQSRPPKGRQRRPSCPLHKKNTPYLRSPPATKRTSSCDSHGASIPSLLGGCRRVPQLWLRRRPTHLGPRCAMRRK
jgi:hypothetical protein